VLALPWVRPVFEVDKEVPVKLQNVALVELPSSKLGLLTTCVGAGVGVGLAVDEVVILDEDTGRTTDEVVAEANAEGVGVADDLGVEDTTTVEERAGDEDARGEVVIVTRVELVKDELVRTTLDGDRAEEDTCALVAEDTKFEEAEATTDADAMELVAGVAAAEEGIDGDDAAGADGEAAGVDGAAAGVDWAAAGVDEDAGAALVLR
jgi:hypothetical protein